MQRRRQQTGLLAAALLLHLALLASIPPVAKGGMQQAHSLRVRLAPVALHPPAALPVEPAEPVAARQPAAPAAAKAPARPVRPQPLQPHPVPPASGAATTGADFPAAPPAAVPARAVSGRIVGDGEFPRGPVVDSGTPAASNQPAGTPQSAPAGDDREAAARPAAAAAAPAIDLDGLLKDYSRQVTSRIKAQQRYPSSAEADGVQGKVKVSFSLAADGSLLSASVASSSGSQELDSAALAAVEAAAPFAPIPAELNRSSAKLSVTLSYSLR